MDRLTTGLTGSRAASVGIKAENGNQCLVSNVLNARLFIIPPLLAIKKKGCSIPDTLTTSTITMAPNHKDIYVKAFSTLRMGLPIFEPSIDVQLGDIGFMDENDGLFHKLYNVAEPPVDIHGRPPAVTLVKAEPRYEPLDAIHVSFMFFLSYLRLF